MENTKTHGKEEEESVVLEIPLGDAKVERMLGREGPNGWETS
jgi:hypothetical protein